MANEVVVERKSIPARDIDRVWTKTKSKYTVLYVITYVFSLNETQFFSVQSLDDGWQKLCSVSLILPVEYVVAATPAADVPSDCSPTLFSPADAAQLD